MAYGYSKGQTVQGDIAGADDANRDTKINFEENYIGLEAGGSSVLVVSGSSVGIGTTTPSTTLHAYANASSAYVATIDNDAGSSAHGLKVTTDGTGTGTNILALEAASTTVFKVRGDGRVGIGVATPGSTLSVDDEIAVGEKLIHRGDDNTYLQFPSNDNITFAAGGSEELKIASDGILVKNIIKHDGDEDTRIVFNDNQVILKAGNIALVTAEKNSTAPHEVTINDGSNNVDFVVKGNGSGEGNPGMKFDASTNKLGINGIGTPDEALHVDGNIKIQGDDPRIKINGDTDSHPGLELYENGTRKWIVFNDYTNDNLTFKTNSNTRMSIQQDGNVGIGTTSPGSTLSVNGSYAGKVAEVTSFPHTVQADSWLISCGGSGARTINLPAASSNAGRVLMIKDELGNASGNNITIDGNSNENIDGSTTFVMNQDKACVTIVCTGTQWVVTSVYSGPPP